MLSGIASFGRSYQDVEHMKGVRPSTSLVERRGRSEKAEESRRRLKKYESKQKQALNRGAQGCASKSFGSTFSIVKSHAGVRFILHVQPHNAHQHIHTHQHHTHIDRGVGSFHQVQTHTTHQHTHARQHHTHIDRGVRFCHQWS